MKSPARRIKRLRVENQRTRILNRDEEQALVEACRGKFRALVTLALLTGAHRGELLAPNGRTSPTTRSSSWRRRMAARDGCR